MLFMYSPNEVTIEEAYATLMQFSPELFQHFRIYKELGYNQRKETTTFLCNMQHPTPLSSSVLTSLKGAGFKLNPLRAFYDFRVQKSEFYN